MPQEHGWDFQSLGPGPETIFTCVDNLLKNNGPAAIEKELEKMDSIYAGHKSPLSDLLERIANYYGHLYATEDEFNTILYMKLLSMSYTLH